MKFKCNICGHDKIIIKLFKSTPDENGKEFLTEVKSYCQKCDSIIKK